MVFLMFVLFLVRKFQDYCTGLWTVDYFNDDHKQDDSCQEKDPRPERYVFILLELYVNLNCYDYFAQQNHHIANDFMCLFHCKQRSTETRFNHLRSGYIAKDELDQNKKWQYNGKGHLNDL